LQHIVYIVELYIGYTFSLSIGLAVYSLFNKGALVKCFLLK
jgi:hypothetical protein